MPVLAMGGEESGGENAANAMKLALSSVGLAADPVMPHIAALAIAAVLGFACATLAYRRGGR